MLLVPLLALQLAVPPAAPPRAAAAAAAAPRTIAIDERLAADAHLRVGDRLVVRASPTGLGDTVVVGAIVRRSADPSEVARGEYRVLMHLDQLQSLIGYGDRVDRFAVATAGAAATDRALARINDAAFGFQAYRSRDIAVETSQTFLVVSRFHRAIGVITIVASAVFLLCIMLLKVDERRRDVAALRLMGISSATVLKAIVLEATLVATAGSVLGVGIGVAASALVNAHYRGVYRTPLAFTIVTPDVVAFAVALSLGLGVAAGFFAARRLTRVHPLVLFGR
ncbi:MAG TPA: FtsX-like permease family protein [Gemmatimonadaceae bacterium]|nr:FtsX-like permease family protein [Gemmatimonadaceae bacterium]